MDVIATHTNADFDSLGGMIAASLLYPDALLVFPGGQESALRTLVERHPELLPPICRIKDIPLASVNRLILVDCQDSGRIGALAPLLENPAVELVIYDHHPQAPTGRVADSGEIRPSGAVSTLLTERLRQSGVIPTPAQATLILLGIHEDTGRLLFPATGAEDYRAAAWLVEQGADLQVVAESLTQELTGEQLELINSLMKHLREVTINGFTIAIAHAEAHRHVADIASLAHIIKDLEHREVLFLVVAMEGHVHIVARSRRPEVNVGEILRYLHGGGHGAAASATIHHLDLRQVLEHLDALLRVSVPFPVRAGEIMSSPVKVVPQQATIGDTREYLIRYNCTSLPVMEGEQMIGLISRKTVERAMHHHLEAALVSDYMQSEFMRATPETPLGEIQEYLVKSNQRLVPVFEQQNLVGVITRTDLLRHLYRGMEIGSDVNDDGTGTAEPAQRSIASLLARRLPPMTLQRLQDLGAVADQLEVRAHVVGGFVRDVIIGRDNLDIDVTIEGDGIAFAERFATLYNCRVRSHRAFRTAVLIFPDTSTVDVASTRLEYYDAPGMLPTVEGSSLRHDLYRRDFTINTLAACINHDRFGMVTDFFGGQQDIQEGVVRVLHNLSLVEDPTRVFRAVRFEQRLGFRIAPHTEKLIRNAVSMGLPAKVGGLRLLNELIHIMSEQEPGGAINRMVSFRLLPFIHPALRYTPTTARVLAETGRVLAWFRLLYLDLHCEQWQVYFLGLCSAMKQVDFLDACHRLAIAGRPLAQIFERRALALARLREIQRHVKRFQPVTNSRIHSWFHTLPLELLLHMGARATSDEVRRFISLYLTKLRTIRCSTDGNQLRSLGLTPGPHFAKIQSILLKARLDSDVHTDEEELALARSLVGSDQFRS